MGRDAPRTPRLALALALALLTTSASFLGACSRAAPDSTPEGAVRLWIETMEASTDDPRATREAYALLGPAAQENLTERASRAGKVQGRRVEPHEMLAEGRFGLKFRPKAMTAQDDGARALVEVTGDDPQTEHARVRCAKVTSPDGKAHWRVEPELPQSSDVVRRPGDGREVE